MEKNHDCRSVACSACGYEACPFCYRWCPSCGRSTAPGMATAVRAEDAALTARLAVESELANALGWWLVNLGAGELLSLRVSTTRIESLIVAREWLLEQRTRARADFHRSLYSPALEARLERCGCGHSHESHVAASSGSVLRRCRICGASCGAVYGSNAPV